MILYYISLLLYRRLLDRFFGIRDSEFKSKIGTRFGIEIMFGRGMPKITLGITGLKNPIGDPHIGTVYALAVVTSLKKRVVLLPIWAHSTTVVTLCGPRLYEENLSRVEESFAYPIHSRTGEPTFPTIPYKIWRAVYMRTKKLFQLEGWPA